MSDAEMLDLDNEIAIIGMAGRFPGAKNIDALWRNLCNGVESISFFSEGELESSDPAALADPAYVKAGGVLEDIDMFDASFFGFSPREAELTDPQHRVFLECAWNALEHAGYEPQTYQGRIGVYAGSAVNSYFLSNLYPNRDLINLGGSFQTSIGNEKDFFPTRVSYKLNLKGPSITVQTACSTSLVAVHLACQSLLNGECEIALAGGVAIKVPQKAGYLYQEGDISSPDGHCRAFDAAAQGTVGGSGVGIVVLKPLADALAHGDTIHAVIKGSAINNDGARKAGYAAPSVQGQAAVIAEAIASARISPDTISYIEAHGTGTSLGDPVEVAALTQAFRSATGRKGFCAIGSIKTNIGHLDTAAGVVGLIKTVLALKHRLLPPSLHFERPNPEIDFASSPFYVNTSLSEWRADQAPRRAGVSSFGIGGTNAHVILQEAPPCAPSNASRPWHLLPLSARRDAALDALTAQLIERLRVDPDVQLADVAHTLQVGRRAFDRRRIVVCQDRRDAIAALETLDPQNVATARCESTNRPVAFLFPGQGAQRARMTQQLYQSEPVFREHVDRCAALLRPHLGLDLRDVLYPAEGSGIRDQGSGGERDADWQVRSPNPDPRPQALDQTQYTQPALFVVEYALAQLWRSWGVRPAAMIGHSIGEYVAACLSGVFSLEDALAIVAARGRLMQQLPSGAMIAVALAESEALPLLDRRLALAAVNEPRQCVISGPTDAIEALEQQLAEQAVRILRLHTTRAFHSPMITPIVGAFAHQLNSVALNPAKIPYLSNVTGTWITEQESRSQHYWVQQMCQTVRFAEGVRELLKRPDLILLEVGPGRALSTLARRCCDAPAERTIVASLPDDERPEDALLAGALGRLWLAGAHVDWSKIYAHEQRRRVPLPTYPFARERHWVEPPRPSADARRRRIALAKQPDVGDWFYMPVWKQSLPPNPPAQPRADARSVWLVFADGCGLGAQLARRLQQQGQDAVTVTVGEEFARLGDQAYTIDPRRRESYSALLSALAALGKVPATVVHLWGVSEPVAALSDSERFETTQAMGFYSLLSLTQAFDEQAIIRPLRIGVITNAMQEVTGAQPLHIEKATVAGLCKVIPQEYPNLTCQCIDIALPQSDARQAGRLVDQLIAELLDQRADPTLAYRGHHRWVQTFEQVRSPGITPDVPLLREGGVYLITGGLGHIGLTLAAYLARAYRAKLILTARSALPAREEWERRLAAQDDVSRKIRGVQALEALGAEVLVAGADVADQRCMRALIDQVQARFGALHGVIHAAGVVGERAMRTVQETDRRLCEEHFHPKVHGLYALEHALQGAPIDFCMLLSSLSAVLGGLGFAAYAAANTFMDAFAHQQNQLGGALWISVNWDGWQTAPAQSPAAVSSSLTIAPQEGVEAFQHILSLAAAGQIVVSTADLHARLDRWIKSGGPADRDGAPRETPARVDPFVDPRTETEALLAAIWAEALGLERVGMDDNFFDLGGHSLLVFQVISRMRRATHLHLPMSSIQMAPTIARLAEYIELLRWARHDPDIAHQDAHAIPAGSEPMAAQEDRGAPAGERSAVIDLLSSLRRLNVRLWAEDRTVRYSAPPGALTPALQAELGARTSGILAFLDEAAAAQLAIRADQRVITGQVPLTPVQRMFFAQNPPAPHHWNIAMLIDLPSVRAALVRRALRRVLQHHDGLRLRFVRSDAGWQQRIADLDDEIPFSCVDLAALAADARRAAFAAVARAQQFSLNLSRGPLLRVVLVEYGPSPAQLLVIVNHLVCDGFSLRIVLQDFAQAYRQLAAGEPVRLPPKTTSFKQWAERMSAYAQSADLRRELGYWLTTLQAPIARLPVDRPGGALTEADTRLVRLALTREETAQLNERLRVDETTITDVLLTALALAFAGWTGEPAWLIELVSHGRETIFDDIDLSRTVGWLVNHVPVRLCVDTARSAAANLQQVKAQLRQIPNHGFGFEALRYLTKDVDLADTLAALPRSQVIFNFLGHDDGAGNDSDPFAEQPELGPTGLHKNIPSFLLIFNGIFFGDRLHLALTYSAASHDQRVIAALGQRILAALRELL